MRDGRGVCGSAVREGSPYRRRRPRHQDHEVTFHMAQSIRNPPEGVLSHEIIDQSARKIVETVADQMPPCAALFPLPTDKHRYGHPRPAHRQRTRANTSRMRVHNALIIHRSQRKDDRRPAAHRRLPAGVDIEIKDSVRLIPHSHCKICSGGHHKNCRAFTLGERVR